MGDSNDLRRKILSGIIPDEKTLLIYADLVDVIGRRCTAVEGGVPFMLVEPIELSAGIKEIIRCIELIKPEILDRVICGSVDERRIICIGVGTNPNRGLEEFFVQLSDALRATCGGVGGDAFAAGASRFRAGRSAEDAKSEARSALGLALVDGASQIIHFREGMTNEPANRATPSILVVEDDESMLQLIRASLESSGLNVYGARDALEAERAAKQQAPDVVVLDVNLPGIDGITLATRLRGRARTQKIPILFVSASSDPQTKIDGLRHGDDYLCKPFATKELVARIRNLAT
ncbi:MAG: response regulator transcription factor [Nannocystaceae bacterium]